MLGRALAFAALLVSGAQAQGGLEWTGKAFLLRICEANPGLQVPKYSGTGPLCGDGYVRKTHATRPARRS